MANRAEWHCHQMAFSLCKECGRTSLMNRQGCASALNVKWPQPGRKGFSHVSAKRPNESDSWNPPTHTLTRTLLARNKVNTQLVVGQHTAFSLWQTEKYRHFLKPFSGLQIEFKLMVFWLFCSNSLKWPKLNLRLINENSWIFLKVMDAFKLWLKAFILRGYMCIIAKEK